MSSKNLPIGFNDTWDQVITPTRGFLNLGLASTWRYRELIFVLVKRDFVSVYKQTLLGPLWFVIQPVATALVFVLLFGQIVRIPTGQIPPFLFYFSGLVMWNFFGSSFAKTSDIFTNNAAIFGKVYFPRLVVPISTVISNLVTFAIQFILFFIFMIFFGFAGSALSMLKAAILTVPVLCFAGMLGLGVGIGVSSLTTRFRDLGHLSGFVLQLWMYATPVIYPVSIVPPQWRIISLLNPMTAPVETFRHLWLGADPAEPRLWVASLVAVSVLLFVGLVLFSHTEKNSTDTV